MYYLKCDYQKTEHPSKYRIRLEYLNPKTKDRFAYTVNKELLTLVTRDKALVQVYLLAVVGKETHVYISDMVAGTSMIKVPTRDVIEAHPDDLKEVIAKNFVGSLTD